MKTDLKESDDHSARVLKATEELLNELESTNNRQTQFSKRIISQISFFLGLLLIALILENYFISDLVNLPNPIAAGFGAFTCLFVGSYLKSDKVSYLKSLSIGLLCLVTYLFAVYINKSLPINLLPGVIAFISVITAPEISLVVCIISISASALVLFDPLYGVSSSAASRFIVANAYLLVVMQLLTRNQTRLKKTTLNAMSGLKGIAENLGLELEEMTLQRNMALDFDPETRLLNKDSFRKRVSTKLKSRSFNHPVIIVRVEIIPLIESLRGLSIKSYNEIILRISSALNTFSKSGHVGRDSKWEFLVSRDVGDSEVDFKNELGHLISDLNHIMKSSHSFLNNRIRTGVAVWSSDGKTFGEVSRATEDALVFAHLNNSSEPIWYEPSLRSKIEDLHLLADSIDSGLNNHEFFFEYQPTVDSNSSEIEFYECLMRWNHPRLGRLPPARFIPLSIETGHIVSLTIWSLLEGEALSRKFNDDKTKLQRFSINIPPAFLKWCLRNPNDAEQFFNGLSLIPSSIILEVTEESFLDYEPEMIDLFVNLKTRGFLIALDDFGSGYSSLSLVTHLPLDYLKIDRSLVVGIHASERQKKTFGAIINLAKDLGIKVISEGVEEREELNVISELGVDFVQGYLISKPLPTPYFDGKSH